MKCSNCGNEIPRGTGTMFVYKTGDLAYYCSHKCYKNHYVMGRKINRKLVAQPAKTKAAQPKAEIKTEKK